MIGFLLFNIARILSFALIPIGMVYAMFRPYRNDYFYKLAIAIDQLGNVAMSRIFNDILIHSGGHQFGWEDETISSVLGKNLKKGTLKPLGLFLVYILDKLDENHSIKSIE